MVRFLVVVLLLIGVEASAQSYRGVSAGYRWSGIPGFLLGSSFSNHESVQAHAGQVEFFRGSGRGYWSVGMLMGGLVVPDGYWRVKDTLPEEGVFAEFPLRFVGGTISRTWQFPLGAGWSVNPTVGLGLLGLIGDIYATEVIPGCKELPCGHWNQVTRHPVALSSRVLPVFQAFVGLGYELFPGAQVSLETGFVNLPFLGLSVRVVP